MSFAENIIKNIGKNISKNWSGKYSQKHFDHTKQFAPDVLQTGDLIGKKIADKIKKVSRTSTQNSSQKVENERKKYRIW